jgi:hypothetical protein
MSESIYQFVLDGLQETKGEWPAVSEATGISIRTIEKIARREVEDPGVSKIEILAAYFRGRRAKRNPERRAAT